MRESRQAFDKWAENKWGVFLCPCANCRDKIYYAVWQAAERETRERCAQIARLIAERADENGMVITAAGDPEMGNIKAPLPEVLEMQIRKGGA